MNHANTGMKVYANNVSNIRQRKFESTSKVNSSEMVGLESEESIQSNIFDAAMELEMKSDEETESDGEQHTRRLIPSSMEHHRVITNNDDKESAVVRNCQLKRLEEENLWSTSIQMFVPFLLAGFGMVAASLLLDVVQVRRNAKCRGAARRGS